MCRTSSNQVSQKKQEIKELSCSNDEKTTKTAPRGGASNKKRILVKAAADKDKACSPVNLNEVLLIFSSLDSKTKWDDEHDVKFALKTIEEITLKPRFELEWGFATEEEHLIGMKLLEKITKNLYEKDTETNLIVENVSKQLQQSWI